VCKVRGTTLNYSASHLVNFDIIRDMILKGKEGEKREIVVRTDNFNFRQLADKHVTQANKKRLIVQKGGFLLPLLTAVLPTLATLLFRSRPG
jgi:hypothetical protein